MDILCPELSYVAASGELDRDFLYFRFEPVLTGSDASLRRQGSTLLDRDGLSVFDHLPATVLDTAVTADLANSAITLNRDGAGNVSGVIAGRIFGGTGGDTLTGNLFVNAIGDTGNGNLIGGRFSVVSKLTEYLQWSGFR